MMAVKLAALKEALWDKQKVGELVVTSAD